MSGVPQRGQMPLLGPRRNMGRGVWPVTYAADNKETIFLLYVSEQTRKTAYVLALSARITGDIPTPPPHPHMPQIGKNGKAGLKERIKYTSGHKVGWKRKYRQRETARTEPSFVNLSFNNSTHFTWHRKK